MASKLRSLSSVSRVLPCPPLTRSKWIGVPKIRSTGFGKAGFREPEVLRSYEQIQHDQSTSDPEVERLVNIGFSSGITAKERKKREKEQLEALRKIRSDSTLEKAARNRNLKISLDEVESDWRNSEQAAQDLCNSAMHYGIFQDLFGDAYFYPQIPLDVSFSVGEEEVMPVCRGNLISPSDAIKRPEISYDAPDGSFWTLMLTNLDGNLHNRGFEYMHWMVGNIPGNHIGNGEQLVDYLQPIPIRGTGFHRHAFVLFKQSGKLDLSSYKRQQPCVDLNQRNFSTPEFYRRFEKDITPAGLAFFQTEWDTSVTDCFHKVLDMPEPAFEYEHRPLEHPRQLKYPVGRQPFNMYLDRYRDRREIAEEMVKKRLKKLSPFDPEPPRLKWPMAQINLWPRDLPTWKGVEMRKEMLGVSRYKLLYNPWARWGGVN